MKNLLAGRVHPGWCPICGPTAFVQRGPWMRDEYFCRRCGSIPRQRAVIRAVKALGCDRRTTRVHESSPGSSSSRWLAQHFTQYSGSQYWPDIEPGRIGPGGFRCEDLQAMTLPSGSVDLFVTQDVFEHLPDPDAAWREISRVLAPGGVHVCGVPVFSGRETVQRAKPDGSGGITLLMEPDFHGDPFGGKSLVIHEWGDDIHERIEQASGAPTERLATPSWVQGIRGEMLDVLVSRKPA